MNLTFSKISAPEMQSRFVEISPALWAALVRYVIAEGINMETALNQAVRDMIEAA